MKAMITKPEIKDIIANREACIDALTESVHLFNQAIELGNTAVNGDNLFINHWFRKPLHEMVEEIDKRIWRYIFDVSGVKKILDAETISNFEKNIEEDSPALTFDNVQATLLSLTENQGDLFTQSVLNIFKKLSKKHKTNDGFKINNKLIFQSAWYYYGGTSIGGWQPSYNYCAGYSVEAVINDIYRVFRILDNKPLNSDEYLASVMIAQQEKTGKQWVNGYMSAKIFLNGNIHIKLLREDLVKKFNDIIAYHGKDILPDARR